MLTLKDIEVLSAKLHLRGLRVSVRDIAASCKIVKHHFILDIDKLQVRVVRANPSSNNLRSVIEPLLAELKE